MAFHGVIRVTSGGGILWYPGVVSGWYPVVSGGILADLRPPSVENKGYPTATSKRYYNIKRRAVHPRQEKRGEDGRWHAELLIAPTLPADTRLSRILPDDAPSQILG